MSPTTRLCRNIAITTSAATPVVTMPCTVDGKVALASVTAPAAASTKQSGIKRPAVAYAPTTSGLRAGSGCQTAAATPEHQVAPENR